MTTVIHLASPHPGTRVHSSAQVPTHTTGNAGGIARQQAIENALSMALFHVRNGDTTQAIRAATAKAIRAASMLKQACAESAIGGRADCAMNRITTKASALLAAPGDIQ